MTKRPEILAPAGDEVSLEAALRAGADSVYLGLDEGFNARARAKNFGLDNLGATVDRIHRAGAKVYVTMNTLVFESELPFVEELLVAVAKSGADAIIVQDPAVCLLAHAIAPDLEIHASTQMTISSPAAAQFAKALHATRFVVPRESSIDEIRTLAEKTDLELEVFIHGALCVSWSGQCLTSEAWGGRSANRGQCAQSCRLPYDLVVDGETRDLGDVAYLLSPQDLAGTHALPDLVDIGVHGLKVEGRQKGPQYVATAVRGYRELTEGLAAGKPASQERVESLLSDMAVSYTRGLSDGFFAGSDHQALVEGRFPKHRGLLLGKVTRVSPGRVIVAKATREATGAAAIDEKDRSPVGERRVKLPMFGETKNVARAPKAGMGVVFDSGHPEDKSEPGGPIYAVDERSVSERAGTYELAFGRTDLSRVNVGDRVWLTQDPEVQRDVNRLLEADAPTGRNAVSLEVEGEPGKVLRARATLRKGTKHEATAEASSKSLLTVARSSGIDDVLLRSKLGAFGGTPFTLESLATSRLDRNLHLPVSELKEMRRAIVADLDSKLTRERSVDASPHVQPLRASFIVEDRRESPRVVPLCRSEAQLDAVIEAGLSEVELDWMEMVGLSKAAARAREAGLKVNLATLRIEKPGEEGLTDRLLSLSPDAIVVRHWGGFERLRVKTPRPKLLGDFSLNVTNSLTARFLLDRGLDSFTPSFDLDETQLFALLAEVPASRASIVVHHRIPTFHTEHCVYAHLLSRGRDYRSCGRPCETHEVSLRDRVGKTHPVIVDAGCRNTVFNDAPQSAAALVPKLLASGVSRFRIDLVRETKDETTRLLHAYGALVRGELQPERALQLVGTEGRVGVTKTMALFRREDSPTLAR